ncbi:MAG: hypothetical protein JXQ72_07375 [Anaerolineae bacterium]|nr:hypothetical protein [Anaerolineae bacterium]
METELIRTAHNLTIELGPTRWRLLNGPLSAALLDAHDGTLTCSPAFARARRLPETDPLQPVDVARVVVGWAPEHAAWHLGLLLAAHPDHDYRPRWCGLASWPSGDAAEYATPARLAGQSLARILDRPFHLVPPPRPAPDSLDDTQPLEVTAPISAVTPELVAEPDIAPRNAPLVFDDWRLVRVPQGYVWRRRAGWIMGQVIRGAGMLIAAVLFVALGIGTQTNGLASVSPGWLPWMGIAVAVVLVGQAGLLWWRALSAADVVFDLARGEVCRQGRLLGGARWRVPFNAIEYLLISQSPARPQGRSEAGDTMRLVQEVWLHIYDGVRFREIVALGSVEGQSAQWDRVRRSHKRKGRRRLWLRQLDTSAHHAARLLADALDTEVWLDIR